MPMKFIPFAVILVALLSGFLPAWAQAPPAAPAKPDSAEVKKDIEKAKKTAGAEWAPRRISFVKRHGPTA